MQNQFGDVAPIEECLHKRTLGTMTTTVQWITAASGRSAQFRVRCPDCERELDARCWRSEAGAWYLKLRERLAAGRKWHFRFLGDCWVESF